MTPTNIIVEAPTEGVIVDGKIPNEVWLPETEKQAGEAVRFAFERDIAVIPLGNGTKRHIGLPPVRYDVALSTQRLRGIVEYAPEDLTVTVLAGTTLADLQQALAQHGQFLPIDPPLPDRATIGGVIATAMTGPCRCLYGSVREYLLGVRVVQPTGVVTRFGGKVVKNVAGYDMTRLYIGSFGTLGFITEASFKVRPLLEFQATLVTCADDTQAIERFLTAIVHSDVTPAFAELVNAPAIDALSLRHLVTVPLCYCLLVGFDGFREEVDWWVAETRNLAQDAGLMICDALEGSNEAALRAWVRDFHAGNDAVLVLKAIVPSSEVCAFEKAAREALGANAAIVSHSLNGIVRVLVRELSEPPTMAITGLLQHAVKVSGNLIVEKAPTEWKENLPIWGQTNASSSLMRRLKETLDPKGLFAPGRL